MEVENIFIEPVKNTFPTCSKALESYKYWQSLQGKILHTSQWTMIDQTLINRFAELTDDDQWIHTDVERSKNESIFRSTVAHGFLIIALLPKLIKPSYSANDYCAEPRFIINSEVKNIQFIKAVKAGSQIRTVTKLASVQPYRRSVELQLDVNIEEKLLNNCVCLAQTVIKLHY